MCVYIYIYMYINPTLITISESSPSSGGSGPTPGLHNKIPAHKIFARVWVAQKSFFS